MGHKCWLPVLRIISDGVSHSAEELAEIQRLVDTATANLPGGSSIEIANERAELRASEDEAVTVAIEAAGES